MATPRQRRHANTKQTILQTALTLIAEKGLDNLSLREIARRVEYSPAGLYEYFDSKEEILLELARKGNERLVAALHNVPDNLPPVERLVELCLVYVDFSLHSKEYFTLMNNRLPRRASLDEPVSPESPYLVFLQAVENAVDSEEILVREGFGSEEITYSLWAMIHGMAMLKLTHLRHFQADFEMINRLTVVIFMAGLQETMGKAM